MLKTKLQVSDVFVPGGFPQITYIPRDEHELEARVRNVQNNLNKLVVITGMTKSGKTVLVDRVFPQDQTIWIDGGAISDENSFWETVLEQLSAYTYTEHNSNFGKGNSLTFEGTVEGNILLAKAEGTVGTMFQGETNSGVSQHREVSPKVAATEALKKAGCPLIVDDFHYIDNVTQKQIIRALKPKIMRGLPVIFIAIPNRKYDAVQVEREMTGRIENIEMPVWLEPELQNIAYTGFQKLNVIANEALIKDLAKAAYGSPLLMQEFCKAICIRANITQESSTPQCIPADIDIESVFVEIAEHSGRPMFDRLKRGPRARSDRKPRTMINGTTNDVYGLVMEAFKALQPGVDSIRYEELRSKIKDILDPTELPPQKHEISRVLDKIAEISYTDASSTPVIDWQREDSLITITDPFFAFYLRWTC